MSDGASAGHLRSRQAPLIAAGQRCGNIGFRPRQAATRKSQNNPMQSENFASATLGPSAPSK
ncbi:hypothetical protein ABTP08_19850, partial [Acinetobacter baumannii]